MDDQALISQPILPGRFVILRIFAIAVFALWYVSAEAVVVQPVSLGAAQNFTLISSAGVTNAGNSVVHGNVALSLLPTITGFSGTAGPRLVQGEIHYNDSLARQARTDALNAFNTLAGLSYLPANNKTGLDLGNLTLTAGVYHFDSSVGLTGKLILDTQGDPNAIFVFQIGSTLTTAVGSSVSIIGAGTGSDPNVFWQVGSSATLNSQTAFEGNLLAAAAVTLGTGATVENGRVIALGASVMMLGNDLSAPLLTVTPEPSTLVGLILLGVVVFGKVLVGKTKEVFQKTAYSICQK